MLSIEHLYKKFGQFTAVNDLSMSIGQGDFFGLVGANGAGKTTTMKILTGLLTADSGEINFNGENILNNMDNFKSRIGYMPDFFGVYDQLKVYEYMEFFALIYNITGNRFRSLCSQLLKTVGLEDKKDQYVDSLSRGMKQKLCIARCLIHDPDILILDEPASGLDPRARVEVREILKNIHKEGKTIIISSHILSDLAQMCTHLGVIKEGNMIMQDTVTGILEGHGQNEILSISVYNHVDKAAEIIGHTPFVDKMSYKDNDFKITFSGTDLEGALLLKKLIENDVLIRQCKSEQGTLESLFMEMTREED